MKWYRLRENGCPKCKFKLHPLMSGKLIVCNSKKCDFKIKPERMAEIVAQQNEQALQAKPRDEEENRGLLNLL